MAVKFNEDKEVVASVFEKYDFLAVPVVDKTTEKCYNL